MGVKPAFSEPLLARNKHRHMSLWVDKYRPTSLDKLSFHTEHAANLKDLVRCVFCVCVLCVCVRVCVCVCVCATCLSKATHVQAASGDIPHLMVYGPPGAGKKTRVFCFLKEVYGSSVEKVRRGARPLCACIPHSHSHPLARQLKIEHQVFKPTTSSSKTVEISTISSNFHIEVNPRSVCTLLHTHTRTHSHSHTQTQ